MEVTSTRMKVWERCVGRKYSGDLFLFKNMHLTRAGVVLRPKVLSSQRWFASGGNHAHEDHPDGAHYSPEGLRVGFSFRDWD